MEDHRRRPAGQGPGPGAGSPVLLGRDARRHPGAAGGDLPHDRGAIVGLSGVDVSSVALDMTNFATFIATANGKAPSRSGARPSRNAPTCGWSGWAGGHPGRRDPADLARLPRRPARRDPVPRHDRPAAHPVPGGHRRGRGPGRGRGHDRGLHAARTARTTSPTCRHEPHYIGSVPASDCPDLTALPARVRSVADEQRFGGLTAYDTRREAYGTQRRTILTHSPELHAAQARGFDGTTLAKAGKKLDDLAATLARGKTRRPGKSRSGDRGDHAPSPGSAASSPGSSTATSPRTCAWPGPSTRPPAPRWKRKSSASTC